MIAPSEVFTIFFVTLGPLKTLGPYAHRTRGLDEAASHRIAWHAEISPFTARTPWTQLRPCHAGRGLAGVAIHALTLLRVFDGQGDRLRPGDVDLVADLHLGQRLLVLHLAAVLPAVGSGERD